MYQDIALMKNGTYKYVNKTTLKECKSVLVDISSKRMGKMYFRLHPRAYDYYTNKIKQLIFNYNFYRGYIIEDEDEEDFRVEYSIVCDTINDYCSNLALIILTEDIINDYIWVYSSEMGYYYELGDVKVRKRGHKQSKLSFNAFSESLHVYKRSASYEDIIVLKNSKYKTFVKPNIAFNKYVTSLNKDHDILLRVSSTLYMSMEADKIVDLNNASLRERFNIQHGDTIEDTIENNDSSTLFEKNLTDIRHKVSSLRLYNFKIELLNWLYQDEILMGTVLIKPRAFKYVNKYNGKMKGTSIEILDNLCSAYN